jgi:excisionase family DNA binding protein
MPRAPAAIPSRERSCPRRGLSRVEAAEYVGVSSSKFDQLISDGRMPGARRIDGRKIWDVRELDLYFDELPRENQENSWEGV